MTKAKANGEVKRKMEAKAEKERRRRAVEEEDRRKKELEQEQERMAREREEQVAQRVRLERKREAVEALARTRDTNPMGEQDAENEDDGHSQSDDEGGDDEGRCLPLQGLQALVTVDTSAPQSQCPAEDEEEDEDEDEEYQMALKQVSFAYIICIFCLHTRSLLTCLLRPSNGAQAVAGDALFLQARTREARKELFSKG